MSTKMIVYTPISNRIRRTTFGYLTASHPRLDRVQNAVSMVAGAIAGMCVLAITFLTLAEAFSRTVLTAPIGWSVSLIEYYLLPGMAFFGIVTAYRSGAHVAVTSAFRLMPPRMQKILLVLAYVVILVGMAAIGFSGFHAAAFSFDTGESPVPGSSELVIPSWLWRSIVPTAMSMGLVIVTIDLGRELLSPWTRPATDWGSSDDTDLTLEEADTTHLATGAHVTGPRSKEQAQ